MSKPTIAIIGAGLSGLTLAHMLQTHANVTLYEKSRGVGGRMSTRRAEPFVFDHGAPFFTARSKAFNRFLLDYKENGAVKEWSGKVITLQRDRNPTKRIWYEPHLVACPNMNSLCKSLSEGLEIHLGIEIMPPSRSPKGWKLESTTGDDFGYVDMIISTAPPAQTLALFASHLPENSPLSLCRMQSCYSLMLGFNKPWWENWIAARLTDNPIEWLYINSTKPDRAKDITSIVAHSRRDWAESHLDIPTDEVQRMLIQACESATGIALSEASYVATHRWKYATADESRQPSPYIDHDIRLACIGDWCSGSSIEDVYIQSCKLANQLITTWIEKENT